MLKRIVLAAICLAWLIPASPAVAGEQATLTLRSGERISGDLWDLYAAGFRVKVDGTDRDIPTNDVAMIEFAGAPNRAEARERISRGQPTLVMRNGDVVDGRLTDIGGTTPLRLTFSTSSGERNVTSAEVAQIVLAPVTGNGRAAAVATGGRSRNITVRGNQPWTETDIIVREGETLMLRADGQISYAPNARTSAAGVPRGGRGGAETPMPNAPSGALIGRIDDGLPFLIGSQTSVRMPASGRLFLGINDDVVADNSGEYQVMIAGPRR
jgi:hypothetical protein